MRPLLAAARLSWKLLWHDRTRLLTSLGGLAFAVLLMLVQMGFRSSLIDSATALLESLDGDIFIMSREKDCSVERDTIPIIRVQQAQAASGVAAAYPLWFDMHSWRNLENGTFRPVRVIAARVTDPVFLPSAIRAAMPSLERPDTALLDSRSRSYYGHIGPGPAQIQREGLDVVGTFEMAADLEVDGNVIVSDETFFRIGRARPGDIEMIVVKLSTGADPDAVVERLRAALPGDVAVRTKDEMRALDRDHWDSDTPVSMIVLIGLVMGIVVGVVICYQILYTEVADHLAEFATLRAIGFGRGYIVVVVLVEALFLSLVGLVPSLLAGWAIYVGLESATGLLLRLTLPSIAFVSTMTVLMCMAAGILALRKVLQADPAELF